MNREAPVPIRDTIGFFDIVVGFGSGIYGLIAYYKKLTDPAVLMTAGMKAN